MLSLAPKALGSDRLGHSPVDEPRGECVVAWIPLKAAGLDDAPKDQVGTSDLQNRTRGSSLEKLSFGAVTPETV